ncbi:MAG: hypothetical protein ACHQJ6_01885 [Candidatus Berkiellales bacterium]
MFTLKNEPKHKQEIIEQGFTLYQQTLRISLPYSILGALLIFVPQLFFGVNLPLAQPIHLLSLPVNLLVGCWLAAFIFLSALIFRLYCYVYQIKSNFIASVKHALFKIISLILLMVAYSIVIVSGTLLLIIPGIILTFSLMFSFILMLTENQNVLQTLIRSHKIVWPHWWSSFLIMSLPALFGVALYLIIFVSAVGLALFMGLAPSTLFLLVIIANIMLQTFFIPFVFSIALVLLHDLRLRQTLLQPPW